MRSSSSLRSHQERYAAGAPADCTPITSTSGRTALATMHAPRPAAAANGHDDDVDVWPLLENLECPGPDAGDQQRLVARVHVAMAA